MADNTLVSKDTNGDITVNGISGLSFTSHTPTLTGFDKLDISSAVIDYSKYLQIGSLVLWIIKISDLEITSTGGNARLRLTAPIAADTNTTPFAGGAKINDSFGSENESVGVSDWTSTNATDIAFSWTPQYKR